MYDLVDIAEKHVKDILTLSFEHAAPRKAVIVFDRQCELADILFEAYHRCLPDGEFIDFNSVTPEYILNVFSHLEALDLAILIQSTSFRLEAFRIRVELFKRGLKVIEHPHLSRMLGEEARLYIDSLAYDLEYYRGVGLNIKACIDRAQSGIIDSGGEPLIFASPFEPAKLNVGDYRGMKNIGGQFPIGEVFTEAKKLDAVNGQLRIFAFADTTFHVNKPEKPITLVIEKGKVVETLDSTLEFEQVLANIRLDEKDVWIRELGFGMNRTFTSDRLVCDIGTYERMCGIHLSMGLKHASYSKPGFGRRDGKHHVDVFAVTEAVLLDGENIFQNGKWTPSL